MCLVLWGTLARAQPVSPWSIRSTGVTANLWGVAAGGGEIDVLAARVVVVGEQGTILVSADDGATWSRAESGTTRWLTAVTYVSALKRFFAVGDGGIILSSENGHAWVSETSPTTVRLNGVAVSRYPHAVLAVGEAGAGLSIRANGVWSRADVGFEAKWLRGAYSAYSGGVFVGEAGLAYTEPTTAPPTPLPNGAPWDRISMGTAADLEAFVGFTGADFLTVQVAAGAGGTIVQKIGDGPYVQRASGTTERIRGLCYKGGAAVRIITLTASARLGEVFAVGTNGKILRSTDGAGWQSDLSPTNRNLNAVAATSTSVIAVGDGGAILRAGGPNSVPQLNKQPVLGVDDLGRPFAEAAATGEGALSYYWVQLSPGAPFPVGQSGPRHLLPAPLFSVGAAVYQLYVANAFGVARSEPVAANRFLNLAARADVGAGSNILIGGFSISGNLPSGRTVLVRAAGPALADFGIARPLAAPVLTVFANGEIVARNRGWQSNENVAAIGAAANHVGAFSLRSGSADSALLLTLPTGNYTAHVEGADGTSGIALIEVYDVGGTLIDHLANVSARARVRSGEGATIGGLVIAGGIPKKVLIRAAGPALAAFGLTGHLAEPKLTVYREGVAVATGTPWGAAGNLAEIRSASERLKAFPFPEGSKDVALLMELPAGAYTLVVTGADASEGVALIEVYDVPRTGN